ncbi:hypothetical protein FCOIX_1541 [Fusarium coicis]|nr:hypothetical protein FCOIX_1541 [Fusarium coicis]
MTSTVRQMIGDRSPAETEITTPTPAFFPIVNNGIRKTLSKSTEFRSLDTAIRENSLDDNKTFSSDQGEMPQDDRGIVG